jgi:pilus assembly protein Flp/PilA
MKNLTSALVPDSQYVQERQQQSDILPVIWPRSDKPNNMETTKMNNMLLKLYVKFQDLKNREEGQDLVEYALVVALIAFGATAGMTSLATGINTAFNNVSTQLGADISTILL